MPDSKITALTALTAADPAVDMFPVVDVSDTTMAASGTTKRISINNILACSPAATLASATITGDLTVDTNTLKVDSANDRVGVGTASPAAGAKLGVLGATSVSASDYVGSSTWAARFIGSSNGAASGISFLTNSSGGFPTPASIHATPISDYRSALIATYAADSVGAGYFAVNRFNNAAGATVEHYKIDNAGIATWSNVGGVAGTAMTLNSTGLGVGVSPSYKLDIAGSGRFTNNIYVPSSVTYKVGPLSATWAGLRFDSANAMFLDSDASISFRVNGGTSFATAMVLTSSNNIQIANTASAPAAPASGGVLYVEAGALKYRGSSGTVTTIANA